MYFIQGLRGCSVVMMTEFPDDMPPDLKNMADILADYGLTSVLFKTKKGRSWWLKFYAKDEGRVSEILGICNRFPGQNSITWTTKSDGEYLVPIPIPSNDLILLLAGSGRSALRCLEDVLRAAISLRPLIAV